MSNTDSKTNTFTYKAERQCPAAQSVTTPPSPPGEGGGGERLGRGGESLLFLPITIRIRRILIVGGGRVATHKATILSRFTQSVTVVAPEMTDELLRLPFQFIRRPFEADDLARADLLFVCTDDHELNHRIKALAEERGLLASVCDDTAYCDFVSPAIARPAADDPLTIAVGSDARDVHRAIRVRDRINQLIAQGILDID